VELYNVEVVVLVILVVKNILLNDLVSMKIPKTLDVLDYSDGLMIMYLIVTIILEVVIVFMEDNVIQVEQMKLPHV
jgi:hypothetical protein